MSSIRAEPREYVIRQSRPASNVKRAINGALRRTGYQVTRIGDSSAPAVRTPLPARKRSTGRDDRLVAKPTFIMSSVRSGSTLLRVILNSHSQICAPHEMHLRVLKVQVERGFGKLSMAQLGLNERELEHLLWDRLLDRELITSGKSLIVEKTPNNVFMWQRLPKAWPDARFIFLLRHPAAIADSLRRATKDPVDEQVISRTLDYVDKLEEARQGLPGLTVKYEDLVADPERVTAEICEFLGVPWERSMLDYGAQDHGPFLPRIGDWSEKIQSGAIDADIELPPAEAVPERLVEISRAWGYLD